MTEFVGVGNLATWIARTGVEDIIAGMVDFLDEDFRQWERFEKIPRLASHAPIGVIELMPTSNHETYSFKYVNGHPSNPARGFQTVTAFGVLADVHNGYPVFLSEMTLLTALRTAAVSAFAARALARPQPRVHALIGAGSQSEFQALGMRRVLGVDRVRVWDVDPDAIAKFCRNAAAAGLDATPAASAADAVEGADIVTTCTADKARAIVLPDALVRPGMHLNAVGGDCPGKTELDPATLDRAEVFVEFAPQTRIEGEIQAKAPDFPVTELWQVVTGAAVGRTSAEQITLFDSVGFAIEDYTALRYLRESVSGTGLVEDIDLIAEPEDPKDLFGMIPSLIPVG